MLRSPFLVALTLSLSCLSCRASLPDIREAKDDSFEAGVVAEPAGMPGDAATPFAIEPGDVVVLRAAGVDRIEHALSVDATGRIYVPSIGSIEIAGLPLPAAEARVATAMRQRDRFAEVGLSLADTSVRRATVLGAVEHPGAFSLYPSTRLADLVAMSGGPRVERDNVELVDLADVSAARVVRDGAALPVSITRALAGDPLHNVRVRPGDLLYIPPARGTRISVLGSVAQPRVVAYRAGLRLTEALAMAGGSAEWADEADVRIVRGPLSHPKVYRVPLKELWRGEARDVALAPGDVVFVTEHWFGSVTAVVQRLTPFLAASALTVAVAKK